ncbi:MAG: TonB-dependent receptor [Bacteroidota bacterium]
MNNRTALFPVRALLLAACLLVAFTQITTAQPAQTQSSIEGIIRASDGMPVPFANITVKGTAEGTAADINGHYTLTLNLAANAKNRTVTLVAAAIGFQSSATTLTVNTTSTYTLDFNLDEGLLELDGIVVSGNLVETHVKDTPVKVDVISARYLEKIPSANIMEALENVNGLSQQIDCGVCGTNNIRINGMDGPYTAVLIDGMPIMSSLATVYGLNGISPALIQQIEVVKGPMSTLYGSEAMGGVINIITKQAQTAPGLTLNAFGTSDGEYAMDIGVVPTRGKLSTLVSSTLFYNDRFVDKNGDNFSDLTLNKRASLFGKALLTDEEGFKRLAVSARYYFEDRMGGTHDFISQFTPALRGSDQLYGETIKTSRVELLGSYYFPFTAPLRLDIAFNTHAQESFYGDQQYDARQLVAYAQAVLPLYLNPANTLTLGAAMRLQQYDDNTGATGVFAGDMLIQNQVDTRQTPGIFAQHELLPTQNMRLLTGLRLDYQESHGIIPSPRVSLKVNPADNTTLRFNAGTGFRIVNLFTEDHAAYAGARATVLLEKIKPERSVNGTISAQQIVPIPAGPLTVDLDVFYSYFTNKITPDYATPGVIRYENLDGSATTRGISLSLNQNFIGSGLRYTLGGTLLDVFTKEMGEKQALEFAPAFEGVASITYDVALVNLTIDYTANLKGPMHLPVFASPFERPDTSPAFSVHNLQVTREFNTGAGDIVQVYAAVENLFDYTQPAPLIDPGNPFGPNFDTSYVYGPIHGRHFGLGVRLMAR